MPEPIRDGVYAQVSGTVGRTADGRFTIDTMLSDKNQYADHVTVWKADFPAATGDRIAVKGWLSWKKTEKDGKVYVDTSINEPKLVAQEAAGPIRPSSTDEEMPF